MAPEAGELTQKDGVDDKAYRTGSNGRLRAKPEDEEEDEEEDEDDDDDDEDEPRLKYALLTKNLKPVYRNGDATSAFLVAGDKMIIGTHNGNIHVLSLPSLKSVRVYHAHSTSISALSISPFPPPLPATKGEVASRITSEYKVSKGSPAQSLSSTNATSPASQSPRQPPVLLTPSNAIHIASASIDGNVCVSSLTDPKDVLLRNFSRPLNAVALSPDYKNDRSYLSGGLAGNLILTVGGRQGKSAASNADSAAAVAASGWLGAIGLGSNAGKDTVLHRGEGAINTIKWSLSGKYVVWVNEQGIKIMRSHLHLEAAEAESSWKRISHIDHPNSPGWEEMAGVWKAHAEWIDEDGLESDDHAASGRNAAVLSAQTPSHEGAQPLRNGPKRKQFERLVIGWSGTVWIINVYPGGSGVGKEVGERKIGRVEVVTILRTDCIISGVSLYTPNLLLVLAYVNPEEGSSSVETTPRRGVHRRRNALQPEMRIIDITTKEEVCVADTLHVGRFEGLSATDYHLGVLPAVYLSPKSVAQRGALETIGGGIWDATVYSTRLFSSAASVRSGGTPSEPGSSSRASDANVTPSVKTAEGENVPHPSALTHGLKVFIHSPYDCVLATKPTPTDHFSWLDSHEMYEEAWNLLDKYPEVVGIQSEEVPDSSPSTPNKAHGSLVDFFADENSQTTTSAPRNFNSQAEKDKRRIGERWLQQLSSSDNWSEAGKICGKVLGTSSSWEHWVWVFAQADKYEEITPYIPTKQLQPPLPSVVYEIMLGHYVSKDRLRLKELLGRWPPELYDASSIIEAIQRKLKSGDVREDTVESGEMARDWRILMESLALLYIADGRPRQALKCYVQLQDADAAMALIGQSHLVDAVSDDIPGFILLRVSKEQQKTAPLFELEEATIEPIRLLVDEAHHGIVSPQTVISQLSHRYGTPNPYLFFYFRALWNGDTTTEASKALSSPASYNAPLITERLAATEGKSLVSDHADVAVPLFAEYDRPLLMTFLKTSQSYTLQTASAICEHRNYIPELVYLLSKEGRTAQALRLIIDQLGDVSQAIAFAKEQNDPGLWDDLLDYSMSKPSFIRGLLEEVGTAIDPVTLVRRIPAGLEIEGLRQGLSRMIKEYEIQHSISSGVARVLRGEVAAAMAIRGTGQKRGIRFDVGRSSSSHAALVNEGTTQQQPLQAAKIKTGRCPGCGESFINGDTNLLLAFPCTHIFHLPCLLHYNKNNNEEENEIPEALARLLRDEEDEGERQRNDFDRSVGPKVDRAALLRTVARSGCPVSVHTDRR